MEKHTKKSLKTDWSQIAAKSRAKREASSAPVGPELENYRFLLDQALRGKTAPRVLILGATPELRDLAIDLGAQTFAVDISEDMLTSMTEVMRYKDSPKNIYDKVDWLELDKFFEPENFDAILADASLNNVPPAKNEQVLRNCFFLLKPGGFFITRNYVYLPNKAKDTLSQVQQKYDQNRLNWLWLTIHVGQYTDWQSKIYNPQTKEFIYGKVLDLIFDFLKENKLRLSDEDLKRLANMKIHASKIIHISFPEEEWRDLVEKYFDIKDRVRHKNFEWTEYGPIWFLKKK
ncbi:MAG: hypothetical protein A3J62_03055 [Candidatus Buchananbacteria bacterium RIFCSPHIGHO2_02_FULL_38_8]|uniref:Methyltransferase domain-containing protein n=1 Tax=Candidatus Buchananbacteria bacterium RIFCSPHIGHO2_02_FULL_38_8 TaxID=1797538 RepID=A0A1G1Y3J5_9BACT|nr:MAG: hypothetical protein A3J62_03055 [Candidatus Buchananbacteria bacterium RIFCSPHIGHO2_02_FULL_38_8]